MGASCCSNNDLVVKPMLSEVSQLKDPMKRVRSEDIELEAPMRKTDSIHSAQFIRSNDRKIQDAYQLDTGKLGQGSFGSVSRSTHKFTGISRAVKTVSKKSQSSNALKQIREEIEFMKLIDHPSIIKLYETFEDRTHIYLVMELCQGGELFDRILGAGFFMEAQAAILMQQILHAVSYLHRLDIVHRDLKPENFLLFNGDSIDSSTNCLKLIDFGLSKKCPPGAFLKTRVGTAFYISPQVLQRRYDRAADMWSVGVLMFTLLSGSLPFAGSTDAEVFSNIKAGSWTFGRETWMAVSRDAKSLIRKLLEVNYKTRYTAAKALSHSWILNMKPAVWPEATLGDKFVRKLVNFRSQHHLKKAGLEVIARNLDQDKISCIRHTFETLDANADGQLTVLDLRRSAESAGVTMLDSLAKKILDSVDMDGSGAIYYTEFLAASLDRKTYLTEDMCLAAFDVLDMDGDGGITLEDLQHVLSIGSPHQALDGSSDGASLVELFDDVDIDHNGSIDFCEFMNLMRAQSTAGSVSVSSCRSKRSRFASLASDASKTSRRSRGRTDFLLHAYAGE